MQKQMEQVDVINRHEELVSVIGFESFIKMCRHYGGTSIYIPTYESISRDFKYKMMLEELSKNNLSIKKLSAKYGISERTIYRLIQKKRKNDLNWEEKYGV